MVSQRASAQSTADVVADGLFSHPDVQPATTKTAVAAKQGFYTDLFREPTS
ncbi:hypothetical protein AB0A63_19555 [Lentzea sp. NPDC042327]|uniref:hypothetical protein n=1 Tax=Lentzea sp. NPDC042327 TaxID=3154801 RepID=UPI003402AB4B